jgi:hypothetical protein
MHEGILWGESKPCEFWAVEDLIGRSDGVKILGGIGKTCSVILTRRSRSTPGINSTTNKNTQAGTNGEEPEEEEEDQGEETEFSMVDSKEKAEIGKWARQHQHLFGIAGGRTPVEEPPKTEKVIPRGPLTIHQLGDENESSDEDFTVSSDDDSSAATDSYSESSEGEGNGEDDEDRGEEGEGNDRDSGVSGGESEEEELDPKNHPLLRAGRLPRMSKAVMDMAVGMVMDDIVGDSDDEEIDELMD